MWFCRFAFVDTWYLIKIYSRKVGHLYWSLRVTFIFPKKRDFISGRSYRAKKDFPNSIEKCNFCLLKRIPKPKIGILVSTGWQFSLENDKWACILLVMDQEQTLGQACTLVYENSTMQKKLSISFLLSQSAQRRHKIFSWTQCESMIVHFGGQQLYYKTWIVNYSQEMIVQCEDFMCGGTNVLYWLTHG